MHVGIDDTDSVEGMCTTYLCAMLCEALGVTSLPKLIRLNPNIPYKTRGNGAVAFTVDGEPDEIKKTVLEMVEKYSQVRDEKTNPGAVFLDSLSRKNERILNDFYMRAVSELVTIEDADDVAKAVGAEVHKYKNGRGIIGALAAVGAKLPDRTYEIIAYRSGRKKGRRIDHGSVFLMDEKTYPGTFNNVDRKTGRILITPRGVDPVYAGIRGNTPRIVETAWKMIRPLDKVERTQVFVTNQGTDAHVRRKKIKDIRPYDCVMVEGTISEESRTIKGGHVFIGLSDDTGKIDLAAYKPSVEFREVIRRLEPGDIVRGYGGVSKYPATLNLEKIEVLGLANRVVKEAPVCCKKKMTSAGKDAGYKCRKCGKKTREAYTKETKRDLSLGFYEPPPGARRHLSKPLIRMHLKQVRGNTGSSAPAKRPSDASC